MSNIATRARDVLLLTRYDALVATPPRDVSTPELLLELHFGLHPEHQTCFPASGWEAFARIALAIDGEDLVEVLTPKEEAGRPRAASTANTNQLGLFDGA